MEIMTSPRAALKRKMAVATENIDVAAFNCMIWDTLDAGQRDRSQTLMQKSVIEGNLQALDSMLMLGLEWKQELTSAKNNPMHTALLEKNVPGVKMMMKMKNLIHEPNAYGESPLHLACRMNLEEVATDLLAQGAEVDARDNEECTPLYHAVCQRSVQCVKFLIKEGCDLDALTFQLMSAMDQALVYSYKDIVSLLLRAGCTVEKLQGHVYFRDHSANSFFCSLWENGDLANMQLFLDCGYQISPQEMNSLKSTCHQLQVHQMEADTLKMLKNFSEKPQKLTSLCRRRVRQTLMQIRCQYQTPMDSMICGLPVPVPVKYYLMLTESPSHVKACDLTLPKV